jgi:hypothetical protein
MGPPWRSYKPAFSELLQPGTWPKDLGLGRVQRCRLAPILRPRPLPGPMLGGQGLGWLGPWRRKVSFLENVPLQVNS